MRTCLLGLQLLGLACLLPLLGTWNDGSLFAQSSPSNLSQSNPSQANGPDPMNAPPGEQVIQVFRDALGREMERVRITRAVPVQSYQRKELKETRAVQEWAYETRPTTQYQVTPNTQYQLQTRMQGRWNPFVEPRMVQEYVPVTQYQSNPVTVQVPMAVPKYSTREFTVPVWELVQTTKMEQYEVIRPRIGPAPANPAGQQASAPVMPMDLNRGSLQQNAAQNALAQRTSSPNFPLTYVGSNGGATVNAPVVPLGSMAAKPLINPQQWFAGRSNPPPSNWTTPTYPNSNPQGWLASTQYRAPSWNGNGPLFATSPLAANRWNGSGAASHGYSRPSTMASSNFGTMSGPNMYGQNGYSLPQTASIPGYGSFRDPMQTGLRPTELR